MLAQNFNLDTAAGRAMYRAALAAEREARDKDLATRRAAGTLRSPSATRKRKRHGRR